MPALGHNSSENLNQEQSMYHLIHYQKINGEHCLTLMIMAMILQKSTYRNWGLWNYL